MSVSIPERVWGGLEPDEYEKALRFFLVSIPERVWGGLEPDLLWAAQFDSQVVSIPERVWGGLEQCSPIAPVRIAVLFQSLRGFGVGWSLACTSSSCTQYVSIPERVWGGLERRASESLTVFGFRGTNARTLQV